MADHALVVDGLLQLAAGPGSDSVFFFSTSEYDAKLWRLAEQKLAELVDGIQPCSSSEDSRRAVINYLEGLIKRNFHCKVFPYGSVPLKTYLPHGDIDLTAISNCQSSNATWAKEMCAILEKEEHTHNAGFQVKEVISICAKVPVIKCLVENIIVDISFNQLSGLSTLCFLEEIDRLIGQNHLFKRSIILVKAWCFYESRVLGAQYGLLCTYALDTLVLFVFNVFHRSLRGPLEVLFCFLKFFSKFDWNRYCLSIRGPIPLLSLHKMSAGESFQDLNNGQFLLSEAFLSACREKHSVCFEGNQGNTFNQKFMNIVDPLHPDNNLGHSVNRGSFVRIQSAFAYGARQLEKLLHSTSHVTFVERLDAFFQNTYKLCRGRRPDASSGFELCQQVDASVCDEEAASSESANTEVTAETVVAEHAQLWPSCNETQVQRAFVIEDGELYLRPADRISKCIRNKSFCKFPKVLDLTVLFDDDTHKADGITLFGEDPGCCSFQGLKTSCKRLEKRKAAASSSSRNLCRLLAGPTRRLDRFLYITMNYLASATGLVNGDNSLCNHIFYNILKRKTQSEALRSSISFRDTFSLVPWLLSKIDIQEGRNACMVHLGMQPGEHSSHPIICYKSRYLFPSGSQASLLQEDRDLHHQFAGLSNQTEVDILRGDLATYLLNLEAGRCTPLQEPLPHASRTNICSLPVEQDSALEGLGRPEVVALPISYLHAMPMSDHFGFPKSCKGTGAFFPNLVPGFNSDKRWTNGTRGRGRVKNSKTSSKINLKAKKQENTLLMEGPVHEDLLNSPNKEVSIGGFSGMAINISNWSSRPPAAVVVHYDNMPLPVEMLQFGSINAGLLAGSFLDPSSWSQRACSPEVRACDFGRGIPEFISPKAPIGYCDRGLVILGGEVLDSNLQRPPLGVVTEGL